MNGNILFIVTENATIDTTIDINSFRKTLDLAYVPFHEGTIRYLKEKKMWTAADDSRQKYNEDLQNKYIEAYKTAISKADEKGIRIELNDKEWIKLWEDYKNELGLPRVMVR